MYSVYILLSKKDGKRYIGSTSDLVRRIAEHNNRLVVATKYRRPLTLIYSEVFVTEKEARIRERYFKIHKGYNELKKLFTGLSYTGSTRALGAR